MAFISSGGSGTVNDGDITNAKLANMAQATVKGRASGAGTGVPGDLTAAQLRTLLVAVPPQWERLVSGDANYTIVATTSAVVDQTSTLTAARTRTLPAANALPAGSEVIVGSGAGCSATNTLTIGRAGSDTINGAATAVAISMPYGWRRFVTDGTSAWTWDAGVMRGTNLVTGAVDNAVLRADGTGGVTTQASGCTIPDSAVGALGNVVQTFSNADVTVTAGTTLLVQTGTLSAARTITLPAASGYPAGSTLTILERSGTLSSANWLNIVRAGSDTINGGTAYAMYPTGARHVMLTSDGTSLWTAVSSPNLNGASIYRTGSGRLVMESFDGVELKGNAIVCGGQFYAQNFIELLQVASGGTPNANSARIYAKDLAGNASLYFINEGGVETLVTPHSTTAPDWLYRSGSANPTEELGWSASHYTGVVTHHHRETGVVYRETFGEYNERLGLTGDAALSVRDWDADQAIKVADQEAKIAKWDALPEELRQGDRPEALVAKPRPDWMIDQTSVILAGRERDAARAALRASWAAQPSWIRGPFDGHFRGAQVFLDAGDDDAAADLIRYAEAPGAYTTEQLATFVTLKTTIAAAIAALPSL